MSDRASRREQHELLLSLLKETRSGLNDYSFKHGAILTLFLGWIVSSAPTQSFLQSSALRRVAASGLIVAYVLMYALWTASWRRRSEIVYRQLVELDYMPHRYFEDLRIPALLVVSFIALQSFVCLIALYFVNTI